MSDNLLQRLDVQLWPDQQSRMELMEAITVANVQRKEARARIMELQDALKAVIDWADLALQNPDEFDSHGVKNLDGPAFDNARAVMGAAQEKEDG